MININDVIKDRYRLLKPIGRGSFGEVWLAADQILGINVAIKIYIALDSRGLDEFKNEFKSVYNLHHPNLLRADYFDNIGNNPYLVMPYCPKSVGTLVGSFDATELWRFVKDVASGLAYLHENDISHRDIKPDNILLDEQGNYVITDFGLSTKMRSTLRRASARHVDDTKNQSGTIGYMAPEMFSAKPQAVKATDIWALGATIYEIATGEMPFCGQGGVMELHGAELPELPDRYGKALEQLMVKCLAKEPWDRPTASDILEVASHHVNNGRTKTVGYETYEQELNKIIEENHAEYEKLKYFYDTVKEQADAKIAKPSRKSTIWACITTVTTIVFIIATLMVNDSKKYYESRSESLHSKNSSLQRKLSVLEPFMKDTPILVNNISVWNAGEEDKDIIYSKNTTYIYHSADFISIKNINSEEIFVKFIAPYGLSTGTINGKKSPSGYSYKKSVSLSPFEVKNITSDGWGNETKGNWSAGKYRIEYWYAGKCIGSKTFTIK